MELAAAPETVAAAKDAGKSGGPVATTAPVQRKPANTGGGGMPGAGAPPGSCQILCQGWPTMEHTSGRRMQMLEGQPGIVRHDIRVAKPIVGRLIGSGGSTYRDLATRTGASIFVLDKEGPPPGWSNDWRLVIIMGYDPW